MTLKSAIAAAMIAGAAAALPAVANAHNMDNYQGMGPGMMQGYGMGPGMMQGYGMGPGMMQGYGMGPGMMQGYGMGPGMMQGYGMGPGMMMGQQGAMPPCARGGYGMQQQYGMRHRYGADDDQMGPGMMQRGRGMMGGQGMMQGGQGMMGGQGTMQGGRGMGPGAMQNGAGGGMAPLREDLTVDDVRHMLGHRLEWQGNPNLKLGKVEDQDDDTITAEIVTQDDSVVDRLQVNKHTGWMQPVR